MLMSYSWRSLLRVAVLCLAVPGLVALGLWAVLGETWGSEQNGLGAGFFVTHLPGFTFAFLTPGRGFLCPPSLLAGEGHDLQLSLFPGRQVTRGQFHVTDVQFRHLKGCLNRECF